MISAALLFLRGLSPMLWLAVALAGLLGVQTLRVSHYAAAASAQETNVAQRDTQIAEMRQAEEAAATKASEERRSLEHTRALAAEGVANATDKRVADATVRADRAVRAAVGLRADIAALNSRAVPTDPGAAALAGEARVARELLGSCADEHQRLAKEADGLRAQVMGLQEFAAQACGAGS